MLAIPVDTFEAHGSEPAVVSLPRGDWSLPLGVVLVGCGGRSLLAVLARGMAVTVAHAVPGRQREIWDLEVAASLPFILSAH